MGIVRLLAVCLLLSGCASEKWQTVMAQKDSAPGYQTPGQCSTWAKAMKPKVEGSHLITWIAEGVRHQVLAYNVGTEVWFADNLSQPRWVGSVDSDYVEMAQQFYAPARVQITSVMID